MNDRPWHDHTVLGSAYEQQWDGRYWRHRPMRINLRATRDDPAISFGDDDGPPWSPGPAPDLRRDDPWPPMTNPKKAPANA